MLGCLNASKDEMMRGRAVMKRAEDGRRKTEDRRQMTVVSGQKKASRTLNKGIKYEKNNAGGNDEFGAYAGITFRVADR